MRFGINTFLFACPFTNQSTRWFARFKEWGFETVEISFENPGDCDPAFVKAQLDQHGLKCGSVTPCLGPERDLRGTAAQQRAGVDHMKRTIDLMLALECPRLVGAVYSVVGRCEAVPAPERKRQWKTVAGNLRELCLYAAEHNRIVAL